MVIQRDKEMKRDIALLEKIPTADFFFTKTLA
jgi:hypothetical protein